jgi:hypothetical protein
VVRGSEVQALDVERGQLARERAAFEAERDERLEQQRTERRTEQRRTQAEVIAGDLGHDMDVKRPGYLASLIINAGRKARGEFSEPLTGLAAQIIRQGKIRRAEIADTVVLPENLTARAIVLVAMRVRGEAIPASEESWLSNFLKGSSAEHERGNRETGRNS